MSIINRLKNNSIKTILAVLLVLAILFHSVILTAIGQFTIRDDPLLKSDVVVVLNTGPGIYPRLMAAADLYKKKYAVKVLVNGNRKNESIRKLEAMGYIPAAPWYANRVKILNLLGVPDKDIIIVNGEDAYDTISEAALVGSYLLEQKLLQVIVTSSKYHTKRSGYIWEKQFKNRISIIIHPAEEDPFQVSSWWHDGRQIRWVMAEYGAWFFLIWKDVMDLK